MSLEKRNMEDKTFENKQYTEEVTLKDLILKLIRCYRYILSKWIIVVGFSILGGGLGFTYSLIKKPVYTATTTFVLEETDGSGGIGQLSGLSSMVGLDLGSGGGGIFQGDNILELYKSRSMIEKTLLTEIEYRGKKQLLIDRYIDFNKLREGWAKEPALKNIQFKRAKSSDPRMSASNETRLQDSILTTITDDLNKYNLVVAKPDKKLNFIKAEVKASDEFFAKTFDEQIVKNVNDFFILTKTKKSQDNIAILQRKVDSVRRVMNGAIYIAATVTDATPNLNVTRQSQRLVPVQRSQFNTETNKTILGELGKSLELSKISLLKETPLIQVIDKPIYPLNKTILGKKKGTVLGFLLFGFLSVAFLVTRKIFKSILS